MTGARYIESLRDGREVWIDGKRVDDVTAHPAFKDMIGELARCYDLQNSPEYRDEMTFVEPETGVRTSLSWLLPRSADDLETQAAQQRAVEPVHLGAARPQPRHPRALHHLRAASQGPSSAR